MVPEVTVGQVVAGKYLVERLLGQGGMGLVLLARHAHLGQRVAIKVMRGEALSSAESRERFLREARAAASLQSEHVARVSDVGVLPSGSPFMVMEYVEGEDLARALSRRGPMPVHEAVDCVLEACAGLAEAHAAGIVHRDLKPSNLFLARRPDGSTLVKVLDFGIAKAPASSAHKLTRIGAAPASVSPSLTATGGVMGSPHYMAPEQFESARDVDARADVWALGVILYQLLSGRRPFEGMMYDQIFVAIASGPPQPLRALRPDVPEPLAQVVAWCLAVDRERRLPSVGRLAWSLAPYASSRGAAVSGRAARLLGELAPTVNEPAPSLRPTVAPRPSQLAPTLNTATAPPAPAAPPAPPAPVPLLRRGSTLLYAIVAMFVAGFGVVVGMGLLGVGCLGYFFSRVDSRTAALPRVDTAHVDAVDLLPAARAFALRIEPQAKLRGVKVNGAKGGVVDLASGGSIEYFFQYSYTDSKRNHHEGDLTVEANESALTATRTDIPNEMLTDVPEPRCSSRAAWKAAGGSPTGAGTLTLGTYNGSPKAWDVKPEGGANRSIDPSSCAPLASR